MQWAANNKPFKCLPRRIDTLPVDKLAVKSARKHKAGSEDREIMRKNQKEGRGAEYKKMRVCLNQCMVISSDTGKASQSTLKQHI